MAERYLAVRDIVEQRPDRLLPVTREIIAGGATASALDAFATSYRLAELKHASEAVWDDVDLVMTPTAGTIYRIDAVNADRVRLNSNLGYYTNFMNLLDLAAVAVPARFRDSLCTRGDRCRLAGTNPVAAPRGHASAGRGMRRAHDRVGAEFPTHRRGGRLLARTRTAPGYRLFALPGGTPQRPGLVRAAQGARIAVEVWALPVEQFGGFVATIPSPLGIGKLELEDGRWVCGFLCEEHATRAATDITALADWRAYLAQQAAVQGRSRCSRMVVCSRASPTCVWGWCSCHR